MLNLAKKGILLVLALLLATSMPLAAGQPVPATADTATPSEPPGSAGEEDGEKPRMEIYGHVMTDAGYNAAGNSVRAMRAIRHIAGELGVGLYGPNPE